MEFQRNRLIVSIVSAIVITAIAYVTVFSLLKVGKIGQFDSARKSQKKFTIQLTYQVDEDKLDTKYAKEDIFAAEIDALSRRGDGWLRQPVFITKDQKMSVTLDDVNETDTSMIINSFNSSVPVGFWEMYSLNETFTALGQLYKMANNGSSQLIYPPETNTIDNYNVELGYVNRIDTNAVRRFFDDSSFTKLAPADAVFLYGNTFGSKGEKFVSIYAIKKPNGNTNRALVNESHIQNAVVSSSTSRLPEINLKLTHAGSNVFEQLTRNNINRAMAISVNDYIVSAPRVLSQISGGELTISGNYLSGEASRLAFQFRCKVLPVPITLIHHETKKIKEPIGERMIYFAWLPVMIALFILSYLLYPSLGFDNRSFKHI